MEKQKRILITGAAGFLGSHLCDRFINEGYHVIGMDNLITGQLKNIEHLFPLEHFEFYNHDVSKFIHVAGDLDYILHFASPASPIDYLKIPIQTLKVGSLSAITANMGLLTSGEIQVGSSPLISGSTMTGSGTHLYGDGRFTMGNTTTNINFNGSALTLNGNVVDASNVKNGSLSLVAAFNITGLFTYMGTSGSTLTASTSNTIGTFAITNTSSTGGYLTVTGTGRTGVSGSAANATQSFAIFDGAGNSYFQYGWTREIEDAKSFTFIFYMYGSTTATFYLNGAKSSSASTLVYVTQITAQGIRN